MAVSSSVHKDFAAGTWVECEGAELPVPLCRTGVLQLDHNKVMHIGGQSKLQLQTAQSVSAHYVCMWVLLSSELKCLNVILNSLIVRHTNYYCIC